MTVHGILTAVALATATASSPAAATDSEAVAAGAMRDCGAITTSHGGRFDITATRKVPCKSAKKVGRSFMNGGWESNGGPSSAETYYTNGRFPGWRCGSGTGGGGCRKNNSNARRILIQQS